MRALGTVATRMGSPVRSTSPGPNEQVKVMTSTNGGGSWATSGVASPASDRPDFPAIAISPDGTDAYLTYMAFMQPWQSTNKTPRWFRGVVNHSRLASFNGWPVLRL